MIQALLHMYVYAIILYTFLKIGNVILIDGVGIYSFKMEASELHLPKVDIYINDC